MPGDLAGCVVLQSTAAVENQHAVAEGDRFDGIVGDQQADPAEAFEVCAQRVADLRAGGLVECGEGFVEEEEPGASGQGPCQGHALGLSAGELGGFAPGEVADAEPVEPVPRGAACLGPAHALHAQAVGGVGECGEVREEGSVLGDPGHSASVRGQGCDVGASESQSGVGPWGESEEGAQEGGLARAVGSDHSDGGAGRSVEDDVVEAGDFRVQGALLRWRRRRRRGRWCAVRAPGRFLALRCRLPVPLDGAVGDGSGPAAAQSDEDGHGDREQQQGDGGGGFRLLLEEEVDLQRECLGRSGEVPGEGDGRAELAERPGPGEGGPGGQPGGDQGKGDGEEHP